MKAHNSLYANIEINEEWALNAESDDHELYAGLVHSTDPMSYKSSSEHVQPPISVLSLQNNLMT